MDKINEEQLKLEIAHIFDSGANELRVFEMVKNFIDSRNVVNKNFVLADVMAMLPSVTFLEKVNRVEVIDQNGRSYVNWKPTNKTEISLQDGMKTLKVFISN